MIYLSEFYFPSQNSEANYLAESPRAKMTCYDSFYPFGLFAGRGLKALDHSAQRDGGRFAPAARGTV